MEYNTTEILSNRQISHEGIFRLEVASQGDICPGQFFMLRAAHSGFLLPRPISVCDYSDGILTFVYAVVGRGTGELSRLKKGDCLGLIGPLGNGFPVEGLHGRVSLVGGGVGVAPMLLTARKLVKQGVSVDACLGFRSETFLVDEMRGISNNTYITTEKGSEGQKGLVTSVLKAEEYSAVLCCGPTPMMKAVVEQCRQVGVPVYVSLENKMACGVGGCLVCTCTDRQGKNLRTCKEGPVFRGEDINFEA